MNLRTYYIKMINNNCRRNSRDLESIQMQMQHQMNNNLPPAATTTIRPLSSPPLGPNGHIIDVSSLHQWPNRWTSSSTSSPPSPSSSRASSKLSHEFNEWYQSLGIHSICYEFEPISSSPHSSGPHHFAVASPKTSLKDWVRGQPLAILQLDPADHAVLKIAGKCTTTRIIISVVGGLLIVAALLQIYTHPLLVSSQREKVGVFNKTEMAFCLKKMMASCCCG